MCRVLAYLGRPLVLENLLYKPDLSFVNQTHQAEKLDFLNLAGTGVVAWDAESRDADLPFIYRTTKLAIFDRNLKHLARKLHSTCVLAHLRGVAYTSDASIGEHNLHPFRYEGFRLAMAHNGDLAYFNRMKFDLLPFLKPEIAERIEGTTDSEWIYALLMSHVKDPTADLEADEILEALEATLKVIRAARKKHGICTSSPVNLFICDGNDLVATHFTFDPGSFPDGVPHGIHPDNLTRLGLWYTWGREYGFHDGEWKMLAADESADSVIVSSEPLTREHSSWREVPLQHALYVQRTEQGPSIRVQPLDA